VKQVTFKRAKRVIALHYGAATPSTRKLIQLFSHDSKANKNDIIIKEASRILELREQLGYDTSNIGIDAANRSAVAAQFAALQEVPIKKKWPCLVCKKPIRLHGQQTHAARFQICPGDCSAIGEFYFTRNGSKMRTCNSFKQMYGKDVRELKPTESFDAMLAYMVHVLAHRKRERAARCATQKPYDQPCLNKLRGCKTVQSNRKRQRLRPRARWLSAKRLS